MAASDDEPDDRPQVREGEHVPPAFREEAFHCPWCGVFAQHWWTKLGTYSGKWNPVNTHKSSCTNCKKSTLWTDTLLSSPHVEFRMVFPVVGGGPRPHVDMPDDVRADYEEARTIVGASPRGACALLRLATQKLVNDHLQTEGGDLNDRIRRLVRAGLPPTVQQSLDVLRVIGNEAVHPGELDLRDDVDTANSLFMLLNVIVDERISRPRQIAEMYAKLPAGKLQGIVNRDNAAQTGDGS